MANTNLDDLFRNLNQFGLDSRHMDDAIRACSENFGMDAGKAAENPFLVVAMYQAMGVMRMAQGQQAILAEMKKLNTKLKGLEEALAASGNKISDKINNINFV